jgi:hypothetical protein
VDTVQKVTMHFKLAALVINTGVAYAMYDTSGTRSGGTRKRWRYV